MVKDRTIEEQQNSDVVVILRFRGGVVSRDVLATIVDTNLDIIVSRKVRASDNLNQLGMLSIGGCRLPVYSVTHFYY
jgi:predicted phosphoribosyltransferase